MSVAAYALAIIDAILNAAALTAMATGPTSVDLAMPTVTAAIVASAIRLNA